MPRFTEALAESPPELNLPPKAFVDALSPRPEIWGLTGVFGKDGILTPEEQTLLDEIQLEAAQELITHANTQTPDQPFPMISMATGIGKGKIIHEVIRLQKLQKPDSKILIIAGTKIMLIDQTEEALGRYIEQEERQENPVASKNLEHEDEGAEIDQLLHEPDQFEGYTVGRLGQEAVDVQIAIIPTIQSFHKRGVLRPEDFDLVIVDEVHNIGTDQRLAAVKEFKKVIGCTATAYRHTGALRAPEEYGFVVIKSLPLPEAQEKRLLPPLYEMQYNTAELIEEIPVSSSGKIDYRQLERILKEHPSLYDYIADKLAQTIGQEGRRYKTGVVVNFVWEAVLLAGKLRKRGITVGLSINERAAKALHTDEIPTIDSEQRFKLPHNNPRAVQVLISPYKAGEGFDAPFMECLAWASPTDSSVRYTQYTGRLARRAPGKGYGLVLDFLYQTSQFNYSYNFAMWMKEDVEQLENGMLYLGPSKNTTPLVFSTISHDHTTLKSLQEGPLLQIQETDLIVNQQKLASIFVSGARLLPLAQSVFAELKKGTPEVTTYRKHGTRTVPVVTEPKQFIGEMVRRGARLKTTELLPPQPNDFLPTQANLGQVFAMSYKNIAPILNRALRQLKERGPNGVARRRTVDGKILTVAIDRESFVKQMVSLGAPLKDEETLPIQPNDFVLSEEALKKVFHATGEKTRRTAQKAREILTNNGSQTIRRRKLGRMQRIVYVTTDKQRFINTMLELGARLRDENILPIQPTDFRPNQPGLRALFKAKKVTLDSLSQRVIQELKQTNPGWFANRKGPGGKIREVITNRQGFIEEMIKRGAKLKNPDPQNFN